ncbi:MAG: phosphatidylserine decarboxylase family protein [Pirellulales bacterium]
MDSPAATSSPARAPAEPLPANIRGVQPGGGVCYSMEMAWGRVRRGYLRTFRRGYVRRMAELREGDLRGAPHDVLDPRDLKFCSNLCSARWAPEYDRFAWRGRLPFVRWGLAELLLMGLPLLGLTIVAALTPIPWLAIVPGIFLALIVWFFRDPYRDVPQAPGLVVSPADGVVSEVVNLDQHEFVGGPAVRISIFLSVFNVHVNRSPVAGRIVRLNYHPGKFVDARKPESAIINENMVIGLEETEYPYRRMSVRQIAGLLARKIVCDLKPEQQISRGYKFGMIKLGSRTELVIPAEPGLTIDVAVGTVVKAGSTVMARYAT